MSGSKFDAVGYLRRFIDMDFRLPEAEREPFIEATLKSAGIEDCFRSRPGGRGLGDDYGSIKNWLAGLFSGSDLSLRRVAQSIHRLGLVFASLQKDSPSFALAATTAVVMRTLDSRSVRTLQTRGSRRPRGYRLLPIPQSGTK